MKNLFFGSIGILAVLASSADALECGPGGIRAMLANQGFTGELGNRSKLARLGSWGERDNNYNVYWYEHVDKTRQAGHAVRSIIVMDHNCHYLGRYMVSARKPHVRGRIIYFSDVPSSVGNVIALGADGPPQIAWIDGENPEFFK